MNWLQQLARGGDISWLSYYFADFVARQSATSLDELASLSAALVCEANLRGDVCVDLASLCERPLFESGQAGAVDLPRGPPHDRWCAELLTNPCFGAPGTRTPLTLDGTRLYLHRYWHYETRVAQHISGLLPSHH